MSSRITIRKGLSPTTDVQITKSLANQSRSESTVAVNPLNSNNLIAASKKFIDPSKYHFTVSTSYSKNGGLTWHESPLSAPAEWDGMTDPALVFDAHGNAFLVIEPLKFTDDLLGMGMYVYKSLNGGETWFGPTPLHPNDPNDDKQWIASDNNPRSRYFGNVYVAWGASSPLRFSRSVDAGRSWKGVGDEPSGSIVRKINNTYAPEITVGNDGTIHIVWHNLGDSTIKYIRSTNGGESFEEPIDAVTGIIDISSVLPVDAGESFPHFPNGQFRVVTLATGCAISDNRFLVAWADMREGVSRIYYRVAEASGSRWYGPNSGEPLIPWYSANRELHHFHPQLMSTWSVDPIIDYRPVDLNNKSFGNVIGCAFYEFGFKNGKYLVDTMMTASYELSEGFGYLSTVTDKPWDPAVNAPWSHGNPNETFIGEYFGFDTNYDTFFIVWTDTRTGVQELFFDKVSTILLDIHTDYILDDIRRIWRDHTKDDSGVIIIDDKIFQIFSHHPKADILRTLAALDSIERLDNPIRTKLSLKIIEAIGEIVKDWETKLNQS